MYKKKEKKFRDDISWNYKKKKKLLYYCVRVFVYEVLFLTVIDGCDVVETFLEL